MIKMTMTMTTNPFLLLLLVVLAFSSTTNVVFVSARGTLYQEGFIEEIVASERAMTGAFINNPQPGANFGKPMLLISTKSGLVHAMPDPDNDMDNKIEILNIEDKLCTNGERGMQTIAPHPNFDENYYIYIYYTAFEEGCAEDEDGMFGPHNRLSRFKMDPSTLQILDSTEEVLLEGAPTYKFYHNGGSMKFGNDGKLYVTTGDGGGDAYGTSQDLTNLHGCLMRLNDDGTVPDDNPFTVQNGFEGVPCGQSKGQVPAGSSANAVCSEIYSYGLRNPFRIVMDPRETTKTRFYINDVGGAVWEEISVGGTDFAGMNYGWPRYEGPCRFGSTTDCPLYDANAVVPDVEEFVKPLYYYEHRSTNEGGCVSGGAFVPPGLWPDGYEYIYADFIFQGIYNLVPSPEGECSTCVPPLPAYKNETFYQSIKDEDQHENFARIVDMFFG
jgi:glucose/arabinose dehydrogenase